MWFYDANRKWPCWQQQQQQQQKVCNETCPSSTYACFCTIKKKIPNQFGVYVNFVVWQTYFSTKGKNTDKKPTLFMHLFDALGREKEL